LSQYTCIETARRCTPCSCYKCRASNRLQLWRYHRQSNIIAAAFDPGHWRVERLLYDEKRWAPLRNCNGAPAKLKGRLG
jgi:hypothetical protein